MPKIVMKRSVALRTPLMEKGKVVRETVEVNGRKQEVDAQESRYLIGGKVETVDADTADTLIADGHAREYDPVYDEALDPPLDLNPGPKQNLKPTATIKQIRDQEV